MKWVLWAFTALLLISAPMTQEAKAADFVVYSVYRALDLGQANPDAAPITSIQKDYYINMGTANGLREGATLDVYRKLPTYDVQAEKLYREITFKVGTVKVIHVEANAAVARIEKLLAPEKMPSTPYKTVMVGDLVRPSQGD